MQEAQALQVSLPELHLALPAYYVLAVSEASSNLARYDGVRYGLRHPVSIQTLDTLVHSRKQVTWLLLPSHVAEGLVSFRTLHKSACTTKWV